MCEALRELMKEEIEEAVNKAAKEAAEKAARETEQNTVLADIRSLMENTKWTAEKAMTVLNIPVADQAEYAVRLKC